MEIFLDIKLDPTYTARIKEGRGNGIGRHYIPWLKVKDVPSRGRATRVKGWKTGRIHHLLSDLESNHFHLLEWDDTVTDIREQFPLPFEETMEIANRLNYPHPYNRKEKAIVVMTTDLVVNYGNRVVAMTCKYRNDLRDPRVREKLKIEKEYWRRLGVEWKIGTERQIPRELVENILFVHQAYHLDEIWPPISSAQKIVLLQEMLKRFTRGISAEEVTTKLDGLLNLPVGTSLYVFRHFIARKVLLVDMSKPIVLDRPLELLNEINGGKAVASY